MEQIYQLIEEYSKDAEKRMIETRRDIHQHPELGNQEVRTSGIIARRLQELGVNELYTGLGGSTGVLGIIYGAKPGPTVGLRADMDALPIKEETGLSFASTDTMSWGDQGVVPVMHACGHDCHVAMLLAAAEVIIRLKDHLKGKVALIFQPAEEGMASDWNGLSGAEAYLADPVFQEHVHLDASLCLHVAPQLPSGSAGKITFHKGLGGYYMYITRIVVKGKGGHANCYWETVDPIVAAAYIITGIQGVISRNVNHNTNHVSFSIGCVSGGTKFNVIPDEVVIEGALRMTDKNDCDRLWKRVCDAVNGIAASFECSAEISHTFCPAIYNDPELADHLEKILLPALGADMVTSNGDNKGADDYSYFQIQAPGIWGRLSVAPDEACDRMLLHSGNMLVNERGLINGVIAEAAFALLYSEPDGHTVDRNR